MKEEEIKQFAKEHGLTYSEAEVALEMKAQGYFFVHCGAPDFVFYKIKEGVINPTLEDIDPSSIRFKEVKCNGDTLKHEQQIWREILKKKGLDYELINKKIKDTSGLSK